MSTEDRHILEAAINHWGPEAQIHLAQEELAELIVRLSQSVRRRCHVDEVAEEIADVEIMCSQLRLIFGDARVDEIKKAKLQRLRDRINESKRMGYVIEAIAKSVRGERQ